MRTPALGALGVAADVRRRAAARLAHEPGLKSIASFRVQVDDVTSVSARHYAPAEGASRGAALVLAHGAGAGQQHPFMVAFGAGLAARGVDVVTFNFPYTEARRRVPDRAPVLERTWLAVVAAVRELVEPARAALVIGGKSMGGRVASHLAAHHAARTGPIAGLVFLGYPLHPPGRPDERRDAHLPLIAAPMLFVQGERDAFGTPDELRPVLDTLRAPAELVVIDRGDHSFVVPRGQGRTRDAVYAVAQDAVATWIERVTAR